MATLSLAPSALGDSYVDGRSIYPAESASQLSDNPSQLSVEESVALLNYLVGGLLQRAYAAGAQAGAAVGTAAGFSAALSMLTGDNSVISQATGNSSIQASSAGSAAPASMAASSGLSAEALQREKMNHMNGPPAPQAELDAQPELDAVLREADEQADNAPAQAATGAQTAPGVPKSN